MKIFHSITVVLNPGDFMFIRKHPEVRYIVTSHKDDSVMKVTIWKTCADLPFSIMAYCFDESKYDDKYINTHGVSTTPAVSSFIYKGKSEKRAIDAWEALHDCSDNEDKWWKISFDEEANTNED